MQSEVCARPANSFHCGPSSISPDWESLIKSAGLNHSGQGGAYFPIADAISFSDIRSLSAKDGDQVSHHLSTRKSVASSDVQRIKSVSRPTPALAGGARWTLGGLWMACFAQAVGEAYLKEGRTSASTIPSCCVSVSMQVDLRPSLTKSLPCNDRLLAQAFGNVTVAAVVSPLQDESLAPSRMQALARTMAGDMKRRIDRGEAHSASVALTEGRFDEGPPPATIEISNHGVYSTNEGWGLLLSQRFDGYQGMSVVLHSESFSGDMHVCASAGGNLCPAATSALVTRAVSLFTCTKHGK